MFLKENQRIEVIKVICLLLLCFVAFAGVFIRPTLFGFDSYATLLCVQGDCSMLGFQPLAVELFNLMPDSLFFFKIIMFVCFFLSVLALWLISKSFFGERIAWLSIFILLSASPIMLFSFGNFENEIFAWPLLFFAFYYLIQKDLPSLKWLSLPLIGIALFFWGGSAFFLVALVPLYVILSVPALIIIVNSFKLFLNFLFPTNVLESRLFAGFFDLFLLVLFVPFVFGIKNKKLWLSFILLLIFVGLQGKFNLLLIPFLVLGIGFVLTKFELNKYLTILCIVLLLGWQVAFFLQQPTSEDWSIVNSAKQLQVDTNYRLVNDWSVGYWLNYVGVDTNSRGGGSDIDFSLESKPFVALTMQELDCNKIKSYQSVTRNMNLYKCD
jgi:hypothetical protein